MTTLKLRFHGQEIELDATRQGNQFQVTIEGQRIDLQLIHNDGNAVLLERRLPDGTRRRIRAAGHFDGDRRQAWVDGRTFQYERVRRAGQSAEAEMGAALAPTIPSVVSEVLVNVGDRVKAGDKLILLESMKMVIPIQSPCDGTVTAINCAAGDAVQPGVQLIDLEESAEDGA